MTAEAETAGVPAPRTNPDLTGQADAEAVLATAAGAARLPHAWLLTGPRGVGKATLAYRFARHLLARRPGLGADEPQEPGLFGEAELPPAGPEGGAGEGTGLYLPPGDPVFRRVAAGGHPDLFTLEIGADPKTGKPRKEIAVQQVRKAVSFVQMTSAEGGWRVVVVDAADDLNPNAANALLKVLEEPPPQAILLLVSHAPGALLPTIRSRCCHLALRLLPEAEVAALLVRYEPDLDAAEALALARLAEGSIGRALELASSGGLELYGEVVGLLSALAPDEGGEQRAGRLDVARVHGFAERLARGGEGRAFATAGAFLVWWLARLVRAGALGRLPEEVVPGERAIMAGLLARGGLARWLALWDKVSRLLSGVESANLDRKQAMLAAFFELEAVVAGR
jgi:DNA polymerase-3 subunit delta'